MHRTCREPGCAGYSNDETHPGLVEWACLGRDRLGDADVADEVHAAVHHDAKSAHPRLSAPRRRLFRRAPLSFLLFANNRPGHRRPLAICEDDPL